MPAEFTLLGEVQVLVDGQPVDLGHARQRCVLAVLLVDANRLVHTPALVDRVWGDQAPARARNALYGYIHHLRAALDGAADIQRKDGGYLLEVDPNTVDLHRFRALVASARATDDDRHGLTLLDDALALWRGEAFAGTSSPWLDGVRDTLDHDHLQARLDHHDLALGHGRHAEVLPDLLRLAEEHPLDERIAGQLMLALHRSGRSAAALDHYHRLRRRLADDLGVDPGPRVQEVFHLMLANDSPPEPRTPEPAPAEPPPDAPTADQVKPAPGPLRSRTGVIVSIAALILVMAGVLVATQTLRPDDPPAGASPSDTAGSSPAPSISLDPRIPQPAVYDFQLVHSSLCLSERPDQSSGDGEVMQTDCRTDVPVYSLVPWLTGVYRILSDHPQFGEGCLGVRKALKDPGAPVYNDYCDLEAAEEFSVEPFPSVKDGFLIRAIHSGMCLMAENASVIKETPIIQAPCTPDGAGQVFRLIPPVG